jgi:hypothetical protein
METNMSDEILLDQKEAAKRLNICVRKLRELTNKTCEIPVVRIGKSVRYDVADLLAFIQIKKSQPSIAL